MKSVHFLEKCEDECCGGHTACGTKAEDGWNTWNKSEQLPKGVTFKRFKVTCGNCMRTKVYRGIK